VPYQPIDHYGVIGDMRSVALVSKNGSIDWCCLPYFDSPSVFGRILDDRKGGYWSLSPVNDSKLRQMYLPDTNVLVTRFFSDQGIAEITDFMPVGREAGGQTEQPSRQLVRIAKSITGSLRFRMECQPAFDYARAGHDLEFSPDRRIVKFVHEQQNLHLKSPRPLTAEQNGAVLEFTLDSGEESAFALLYPLAHDIPWDEPVDGPTLLLETVRFWRAWAARSHYRGRWREMVMRSALLLKMLTFLPTGAMVAAPTTSLPEQLGGVRNWDYRYTWVRDAAFTVYSLMRLGYTEEAGAFARFIQERAREQVTANDPLNVVYSIHGRTDLAEQTLDHLEGYSCSRPVRIGNAAAGHFQLDIYGELLDSLYLYDKYGAPLSYDMWLSVDRLLDWVAANWEKDDQSIWEVRGGRRPFTFSKLQCWVALDRGIRLARKRSFPTQGLSWLEQRNKIYNAIMTQGWNDQLGVFTQYFGADAVDASLLMLPLMLFVSPTDPRLASTVHRIRKDLAIDSLVRRYKMEEAAPDGLPGSEGFFTVCSFWLVEAMSRAGMAEEAQLLFEKLLGFANHLGLFSEEVSLKGELLGNFPQALTHLGLISAAYNLDRLLG